jgi:hypothetical protein
MKCESCLFLSNVESDGWPILIARFGYQIPGKGGITRFLTCGAKFGYDLIFMRQLLSLRCSRSSNVMLVQCS